MPHRHNYRWCLSDLLARVWSARNDWWTKNDGRPQVHYADGSVLGGRRRRPIRMRR
jgi:hypothetical protein